jgi:hypothetical protein
MNEFYLKRQRSSRRTTETCLILLKKSKIASNFSEMKRPEVHTKKEKFGCLNFCK